MTRVMARARKVTVNYSWCKRCGICIDLCPKRVFEPRSDGAPVVEHSEACSGCGFCVLICPDYAVDWDEAIDTYGGEEDDGN